MLSMVLFNTTDFTTIATSYRSRDARSTRSTANKNTHTNIMSVSIVLLPTFVLQDPFRGVKLLLSLPPLPSLPSLPTLPSLPSLPLPSLPTLPTLPSLPTLPALGPLPALPSLPTYSTYSTYSTFSTYSTVP